MSNPLPPLIHALDWHLLRFSGEDAARFLQGYLTSDIEQLSPDRGHLSAACDSKGRILASLYLFKQSESEHPDLYIFLPAEVWPRLAEFWHPYFVLYRRAEMQELTGCCCMRDQTILIDALAEPLLSLNFDARSRLLLFPAREKKSLAAAPIHLAWNSWLIDKEIPHIYAAGMGRWIPQVLGYDRLGAVSFTKGCYLGQEVVARVHYRGKPNRLCRPLTFALNGAPYINMPFFNAKRDSVGNLVNFYATAPKIYKGLAVISTNVVDMQHLFVQDQEAFKELPLDSRT